MSKLSEIEARNKAKFNPKHIYDIAHAIEDRRYLLGLVREVRDNLREHIRQCVNGGPSLCDVCNKGSYLLDVMEK